MSTSIETPEALVDPVVEGSTEQVVIAQAKNPASVWENQFPFPCGKNDNTLK